MMQGKHPSEAMTGAPGALPGEAIRAPLGCRVDFRVANPTTTWLQHG
jgi:hypothetical protein